VPKDQSLESLSSDFGQYLEDKTFPDVTLKCHDRAIPAHRSVLAARSSVFAAMFRNKMTESETGVVEIGDMDSDMLEDFVNYLYTGKIKDASEDSVSSLFAFGDKYDVRPLQIKCSEWIRDHLTRENCVGFLQMASSHNYEYLINIVAEFIVRDSTIFKSEEWSKFKKLNRRVAFSIYERYIDTLRNVIQSVERNLNCVIF
jgi:speckle-type POZ protein